LYTGSITAGMLAALRFFHFASASKKPVARQESLLKTGYVGL
jgi:hypothetical protein